MRDLPTAYVLCTLRDGTERRVGFAGPHAEFYAKLFLAEIPSRQIDGDYAARQIARARLERVNTYE